MESQPLNPAFRINPENFHPYIILINTLSLLLVTYIIIQKVWKTVWILISWLLRSYMDLTWIYTVSKTEYTRVYFSMKKSNLDPHCF